jgi:hypothetical protein
MVTSTLTPVAPSENIQSKPVAPVTVAEAVAAVPTATTPVKDITGSVVARPGSAAGMSEAYMQAAQTGDPEKMYEFAKSVQGTDFEKPALNAWRGMANRVSKFDEITSAVDKKGGPNSPAGKLELVNQWPKSQNEPSILRGLAEHLLGNPNARYFVSKGMVKPKMVMDINGKPIQENYYENGEKAEPFAIDTITGKEILPQEYATRLAGITDIQQTLPYIASKEQLKVNQEESNKAQYATNDMASASGQLGILHSTAASLSDELFAQLKDQNLISPDERTQLASFGARAVQIGANSSAGLNALDQYTRGGGASMSAEQRKALGGAVAGAGFGVDAGGSVIDKDGKRVDVSKLKSLQQSGAIGANFEQNFNQSANEAKASLMYKKMNGQQQQMFDQLLDVTKMIEQKKLDLAQKHGSNSNMPFLVSPVLSTMGDQYARFQVQQQVGMLNSELMRDYADYRDQIMKSYPKGTFPAPGEIEAAFARTDRYLEKRDAAIAQIKQTMKTIEKTMNTGNVIAKEKVAGEVPQQSVNALKPAVPPIDISSPTAKDQGVVIPEIPQSKNPTGFKVIRNDRQFKVKE